MNPQPATGVAISGANKEQLLKWLDGCYPNRTGVTVIDEIDSPNPSVTEIIEEFPTTQQSNRHNGQADDYLANLQNALKPFITEVETKAIIDDEHIISLIKQYQPEAREIIVKPFEKPAVSVGVAHKMFDQLLTLTACRVPAFLAGPSGSGKTHGASQLAKAMSLPYEAISVGPMTTKADLLGFKDGNGHYHDTGLTRCFKNGGVFLIDEIDAGNASVLTTLNMCLSNGEMGTPEGMIKKHADFMVVAGANTYGTGADPQYCGRCKLDEATLKRFFVVEWDYDEKIEMEISGADSEGSRGIVEEIQRLRKNVSEHQLRVTVSPRDSIYAVRLLKAGMPVKAILQGLVFKGLDASTVSKMKG